MMLTNFTLALNIFIFLSSAPVIQKAQGPSSEPQKVSVCQLKTDPAKYNHKLIEVTGFISHGFENFSIFEPNCSSEHGVWLEYGGTQSSDTMYCCGVTPNQKRPTQLIVEEIPIPLSVDESFQRFDKLIQRRPDSVLHATIVGRFFSGKELKYPAGTFWGGYGHMGCCSLLAIQQVIAVDKQDRPDLDYGASVDQPDISKAGCGYKILTSGGAGGHVIQLQKNADAGEREWSFDNPQRVASDELARLLKIDEKSVTGLKESRRAQGRIVYQWHLKSKKESYMIVVNRPYLLSFYARTKRVAWVVAAAYELSCGG